MTQFTKQDESFPVQQRDPKNARADLGRINQCFIALTGHMCHRGILRINYVFIIVVVVVVGPEYYAESTNTT